MTKESAISDAKKKAALSRQNQVVFRTLGASRPAGERFVYDYTSVDYWPCRRNREPVPTIITTVKFTS